MSLPTLEDFTVTDRPEEDLDGLAAWENFGGLTIEEAYTQFCESPDRYQEDFMWMGDRAFAYYFAVVEDYIRKQEPQLEYDGVTYILALDIGMHVPSEKPEIRRLKARLSSLCDFVLDGLSSLHERPERSRSLLDIAAAWRALRAKVE